MLERFVSTLWRPFSSFLFSSNIQERVYVLSKLETEQSRLYDEIKSLEMKEQDLKDAIAKQQQELARVEEEVSQKKDEYSSQVSFFQPFIFFSVK